VLDGGLARTLTPRNQVRLRVSMGRFITDEVRRVGGRWLALWPVAAKHRLRSQAATGDARGGRQTAEATVRPRLKTSRVKHDLWIVR
jgi:hypothetical protein